MTNSQHLCSPSSSIVSLSKDKMVRRCYICCYRHADPNSGHIHIHQFIQGEGPPFEVTEVSADIPFNPRQHLASPETALAFFSGALARYHDELRVFGDEIAQNAATMAFTNVQNANWQHGLLVMVVVETIPDPDGYIIPPPRTPAEAATVIRLVEGADHAVPGDTNPSPPAADDGVEANDLNDNGDGSGDDDEDEEEEEEEDAPVGLSERDISMLKKEELESDSIGESCCVCLEEFKAGAVITPLSPCSHRFHNLCIVEWLRRNRTCPICRSRVD